MTHYIQRCTSCNGIWSQWGNISANVVTFIKGLCTKCEAQRRVRMKRVLRLNGFPSSCINDLSTHDLKILYQKIEECNASTFETCSPKDRKENQNEKM